MGGFLFGVAFSCAAPPPSEVREGEGAPRTPRHFDTVVITPGEEASRVVGVHFEPDSGVSFTDLGLLRPGDPLPDPRRALARVDSPDIRISTTSFHALANRVAEATAAGRPPQRWGYAYEGGQLRFFFDRSATVGGVVLLGGLVALTVAALALALVLSRRLRRERARRRALILTHEQQVEAQERERSRIAREIHDGPIQDLHALRMRASAEVAAGADVSAAVDAGISEVSVELRAIAEGLRPPSLGRFGLAAALEAHVARLRARRPDIHLATRLDEDAVADGDPDRPCLDERARISLFRVAQEALNNAVEHGAARNVMISLAFEPDPGAPRQVCLEVRDDGRGMNGAAAAELAELVEAGHFGLAGMYERAELLGGSLSVGPCSGEAGWSVDGPPLGGASLKGSPAAGPNGGRGTCLRLTVPWSLASATAASAVRRKR